MTAAVAERAESKSGKQPRAKKPITPWDFCRTQKLHRVNGAFGNTELVDAGANFFVLALEALGATTKFSCQGHPGGFYVSFEADYELALELDNAGYFTVEVSKHRNSWVIRKRCIPENPKVGYTERENIRALRWASEAWVRHFAPRLDHLVPPQ